VLDASDCCHEDDLQHPSNPVVHVLDYRAFTRDWKVDHKRSLKGGPTAVLLPYSINEGPCAGQVGLALVAAADIRPGEACVAQLDGRWTDASHAQSLTKLQMITFPSLMSCKVILGNGYDPVCRMVTSSHTTDETAVKLPSL
jgi:hypothetical protein